VLSERQIADRLVASESAVEIARGAEQVPDHLANVPFALQEGSGPVRGRERLDLGDARDDSPAEDVDRVDRLGRIRIDTDAGSSPLRAASALGDAVGAAGRGSERPGAMPPLPAPFGRRHRSAEQ
jgi:hypothetical protein